MRAVNAVIVRTVHGLMRAEVLKSHLESYGIPVALEYESAAQIYGITVDGLGAVKITVPSRHVRRARRLLAGRHRPVAYRRRFRERRRGNPKDRTRPTTDARRR